MTTEDTGPEISGSSRIDSSRWVEQRDDEFDIEDDDDDINIDTDDVIVDDDSQSDDDYDSIEQRLIRTGPRLDSFDVEANEVPGVNNPLHQFEEYGPWASVVLFLQTLGVVFGDVGTSQLYTFSVMFSKAPIKGKEDVLGALSLVLYTLILIPLVKYVLVVLWANDDGEGGTFALYSLICRHAKVNLIPNHIPSDARLSSFRLKVPSKELERSLKIKERLENSLGLKKLLLGVVLAGTAMVIADGVVTPAMSVVSAVEGLKVGISGISQREVVMVAVALLVILFSVQRYGTSKMGFIVGPALFIWFCCLAWIGIYNLIKYDRDVWRAFNPMHIYYYFERNKIEAWYALGGCLLCATGAEAMFADLCYFSVRTVQLTFVLFVFPCLVLGYLGQAAYLMQNQGNSAHVFYSSVPSGAFWPVFVIANFAALIASRTMTTATFSCIKQSISLGCFPRIKIVHTSRKFMGQIYIPVLNWFLLAACVVLVCSVPRISEIANAYGIAELGVMMMTTILVTLVMLLIWQLNIVVIFVFLILSMGIELTFFTSVLWFVGDGSWIILPFVLAMLLVMAVWNYGNRLKYETEGNQKMSMERLRKLGPNLGTTRAPGIGLVYSDLAKGVPSIFDHFLNTLPAINSMIIFVCIKYVPVPEVPPNERFLFRRVCSKGYHMFRCIARFGYKDVQHKDPQHKDVQRKDVKRKDVQRKDAKKGKHQHQIFEDLLIEGLEKFIRREAQERSLESDDDKDADSDTDTESFSKFVVNPSGSVYSLTVPLLFNDTNKHTSDPSSSREARSETSSEALDPELSLQRELSFIKQANDRGMVYLLCHGDIRAKKESWFIKKLAVNYFYTFLRKNSRRGVKNLSVPQQHLIQVRMTYLV